MTPENKKSKRLMGVFILGWIVLNYPILSLFNHPILVFGIPLLYLYMFAVWALLIALIYMGTRMRPSVSDRHLPALEEDPDA